jgi:hypothetical protein
VFGGGRLLGRTRRLRARAWKPDIDLVGEDASSVATVADDALSFATNGDRDVS